MNAVAKMTSFCLFICANRMSFGMICDCVEWWVRLLYAPDIVSGIELARVALFHFPSLPSNLE